MTLERIFELEAEIARHRRFLELPDMFTVLEVDVVNEYWILRSGNYHLLPAATDLSRRRPYDIIVAGQSLHYQKINFPVHFRDNTKGEVLNYLGGKIKIGIFFAHVFGIGAYSVLDGENGENDNGHFTFGGQLNPPVIYYPHRDPVEFSTTTGTSPLLSVESFKQYIRKEAKGKLKNAEKYFESVTKKTKKENEKEDFQRREAREQAQDLERLKEEIRTGLKI